MLLFFYLYNPQRNRNRAIIINKQFKYYLMKKKGLLICSILALAAATQTHAQEFYIRGGVGFSAQSGKTEFNNADPNGLTNIQQSTDVTIDANGTRVKALNGTLGEGFKANITGGYMFNKYVGAEIGLNYFTGSDRTIGKLTTPGFRSEEVAYLKGLDIVPALYITPAFSKLNPYARIGMIFAAAGKLNIETTAVQTNGGGQGTDIHIDALSEVKSKFSAGFIGALGVTYPIAKKLQVFGEVEFKNFSIKSKTAEIVDYRTTAVTGGQSVLVPGQQLADLPVNEKKFVFSDEYTQGTTTDPNAPRKIPTQFVNVGGVGVNVGIRYSLGK